MYHCSGGVAVGSAPDLPVLTLRLKAAQEAGFATWDKFLSVLGGVEDHLGILSWLVAGFIGGFVGSKVMNRTGDGLVRDIMLSILGVVVRIAAALAHLGA